MAAAFFAPASAPLSEGASNVGRREGWATGTGLALNPPFSGFDFACVVLLIFRLWVGIPRCAAPAQVKEREGGMRAARHRCVVARVCARPY